jgi:hypothetical protein
MRGTVPDLRQIKGRHEDMARALEAERIAKHSKRGRRRHTLRLVSKFFGELKLDGIRLVNTLRPW